MERAQQLGCSLGEQGHDPGRAFRVEPLQTAMAVVRLVNPHLPYYVTLEVPRSTGRSGRTDRTTG
jgi:hypothetical protein